MTAIGRIEVTNKKTSLRRDIVCGHNQVVALRNESNWIETKRNNKIIQKTKWHRRHLGLFGRQRTKVLLKDKRGLWLGKRKVWFLIKVIVI